ncbi:MAG: S-methyl-5-thioribose-1-phosphate isomerase [Gammaproteobacteria bacterium]|nr:S-methyl-5-thioribose-1-phosphate isomerase [Gammaproteobacteria bacterium]
MQNVRDIASDQIDSSGGARAVRTLEWQADHLALLDQRVLPERTEYVRLVDADGVARAIREMVVRGAPAIGVAAAYGVVLAAREADATGLEGQARVQRIEAAARSLGAARPTAVNLAWALKRMLGCARRCAGDPQVLLGEAETIHAEDLAANHAMGAHGARLIESRCAVLTHCNAGALATAGYGTALGVIRAAHAQGKVEQVFADETRPWLQGARLTAWEMVQEGIPVSLIADGAACWAMRQGQIGWVIVGADRVAANGDVANKIGTYALAVSARHHGVGFMVVAPTSTIDMDCASGADIPIEQRAADELLSLHGQRVAAVGAQAWNPVFDVTPAALVDALVTEHGVIRAPDQASIRAHMQAAARS